MIEKLADLLSGNKSGTKETTDPGEGKGPSSDLHEGTPFHGFW
jgi:hypothetical protein